MAEKKSTADILAALRSETKKKAAEGTPPAEPAAPPAAPAPEAAASPAPSETTSTGAKDVLAAARAQGGQKPAAGGAKPKSTADILAALRKETTAGGAGAKPAAATGAGTTTATPAKPAAAKPAAGAGPKPSVQEMLRAVREGTPAAAPVAKPASPKPPRNPVAAKAAKVTQKTESAPKRAFVFAALASPFVLAWVLLSGALGAMTLGLFRFLMPNVLVEPPSKFNVGSLGKYAPDMVSEEYKAANGVWVVRTTFEGNDILYALISVCTHLGCTPGWLQGEQKFKCPCHGSGFYMTGINFEGPAPRPLERAGIRLLPDGTVEVDKSMKFQQEMGQWNDAASFVKLA